MRIAECPIELLDEDSASIDDDRFIFDHLKYSLSKSIIFPSVRITFSKGNIVIQQGAIYYKVAKDLGYEKITVTGLSMTVEEWDIFCQKKGVRVILPEEIYEKDTLQNYTGHTIFLEDKITDNDNVKLKKDISACIGDKNIYDWNYDEVRNLIEFKTGFIGESYISSFYEKLDAFHLNVCQISTYQGKRYPRLRGVIK